MFHKLKPTSKISFFLGIFSAIAIMLSLIIVSAAQASSTYQVSIRNSNFNNIPISNYVYSTVNDTLSSATSVTYNYVYGGPWGRNGSNIFHYSSEHYSRRYQFRSSGGKDTIYGLSTSLQDGCLNGWNGWSKYSNGYGAAVATATNDAFTSYKICGRFSCNGGGTPETNGYTSSGVGWESNDSKTSSDDFTYSNGTIFDFSGGKGIFELHQEGGNTYAEMVAFDAGSTIMQGLINKGKAVHSSYHGSVSKQGPMFSFNGYHGAYFSNSDNANSVNSIRAYISSSKNSDSDSGVNSEHSISPNNAYSWGIAKDIPQDCSAYYDGYIRDSNGNITGGYYKIVATAFHLVDRGSFVSNSNCAFKSDGGLIRASSECADSDYVYLKFKNIGTSADEAAYGNMLDDVTCTSKTHSVAINSYSEQGTYNPDSDTVNFTIISDRTKYGNIGSSAISYVNSNYSDNYQGYADKALVTSTKTSNYSKSFTCYSNTCFNIPVNISGSGKDTGFLHKITVSGITYETTDGSTYYNNNKTAWYTVSGGKLYIPYVNNDMDINLYYASRYIESSNDEVVFDRDKNTSGGDSSDYTTYTNIYSKTAEYKYKNGCQFDLGYKYTTGKKKTTDSQKIDLYLEKIRKTYYFDYLTWVNNGHVRTPANESWSSYVTLDTIHVYRDINYSVNPIQLKQTYYVPLNLNRNGYATSSDLNLNDATENLLASVDNYSEIYDNTELSALDINNDKAFNITFNNDWFGMPNRYDWDNKPSDLDEGTVEDVTDFSSSGYANGRRTSDDDYGDDCTYRFNLTLHADIGDGNRDSNNRATEGLCSLIINNQEYESNNEFTASIANKFRGGNIFTRFINIGGYTTKNMANLDSTMRNWWVSTYNMSNFYEYGSSWKGTIYIPTTSSWSTYKSSYPTGNVTTPNTLHSSGNYLGTAKYVSNTKFTVTTDAESYQRGLYIGRQNLNCCQPVLYGKWEIDTIAGDIIQ